MPHMHRRFSRWMPPVAQRSLGLAGWFAVATLAGLIVAFVLAMPLLALSLFGGLGAVTVYLERKRARRVRTVAAARSGEDIGSFARAFNRRGSDALDPWAIRAVWEALVPLTESRGLRIPLRPTDHVVDDLGLDSEDVEDLVIEIVERCERMPGDWRRNPYYYRPNTVGDLVHLVSAQPLRR